MAIDPVSLAITAAVTAINMAVTASKTIEGPRLKDTGATVADYGTPLNYFVGQRYLPCPSFFAKPIKEVKKKRKGKGGKQVSYSGFGTWASHIADHPITGVDKVWFDNHLVYDDTGSEAKTYPLGPDYELAAHMRVYLGGEAQMPDPDMLAYIEARDGPGTCPAYRPTSYIYFENIPLEMIGNRFPAVSVLTGNYPTPAPEFEGWLYEWTFEDRCWAESGLSWIIWSAPTGDLYHPGIDTGGAWFAAGPNYSYWGSHEGEGVLYKWRINIPVPDTDWWCTWDNPNFSTPPGGYLARLTGTHWDASGGGTFVDEINFSSGQQIRGPFDIGPIEAYP